MDRTGTGHADLHTSSSFAVNNIPTRELKIDPSKDLWTNISVNVREATAEVPDHHILVVGQKGAGKTSLLRRFSALDQCPDLSFSSSANSSQPKRGTRVGKPGSDAGFPSALALEYIPSCKMEPASTISSSSQQHTGGIPGHSLATATSSSSPAVAPTVHYWELGGGSDLSSLIDVVLTPETITTTSVMIVVDASAPDCIFSSSLSWLQRVHTRTAACFERMKSKGNSTPEKMLQRFFNKYGLSTHEDFAATMDAASASTFRICPLPLVLVVTKLDILFQKESDPTRMDFLLRALRYLAHTHCATLVCPPHITGGGDPRSTSHPMLSALEQTNALMAHVCLNVELPQKERFLRRSLEHDPIYVLFGQDSLKQIQAPTSDVQRGTSGISNVSTGPCSELLNRWKRLLLELYPPRDGHHGGGGETGEDSVATRISSIEAFLQAAYTQYAEPSIDAFRQQKDELMEQWRKGRAKKAAQAAAASGENV